MSLALCMCQGRYVLYDWMYIYFTSNIHLDGISQQLQQVSGVAAILRYPLPDLDELEDIAAAHMEDLSDDEVDDEELTEEMRRQREEARVREDMEDMGLI